jgi:hypothetical protein
MGERGVMDKVDSADILLGGSVPPGVYRYAGRTPAATLLCQAQARNWQAWRLNGSAIDGKAAFLAACARAMRFPRYFGRNWDAFEECITDLGWLPAPGYLLLYDHPLPFAIHAPTDWRTALNILGDAADYWRQKERPFYVLLRRTYGVAPDVPLLR